MSQLHALIMAGGSGTRFWPRSRRAFPKQFLPIAGEQSLLAETVERARELGDGDQGVDDRIWILTRADLVEGVAAQLPDFPRNRIVAEPELRDTAPALVFGSAMVEREDPDATLLVMPADHRIPDTDAFVACVRAGQESLAARDGLLTFGIEATEPAVTYGYIRRDPIGGRQVAGHDVHPVASFVEKPDRDTAIRYLETGEYAWNGGIFLWKLRTFRETLAEVAPEYLPGWNALAQLELAQIISQDAAVLEAFRSLPRQSIDYALLEKASNVQVIRASFGWDDVGSWRALERHRAVDDDGNITEGETVLLDSRNSTVLAAQDRVVAAIGIEDLVVIDTPDALLVCPRDRVDELRRLVTELEQRDLDPVL